MGNLAVTWNVIKAPRVFTRIVKNRLDARKSYTADCVPTRKLNLLVLIVTRRCNMRCAMCMQDHEDHRRREEDRIGPEDYRRILTQAKEWNPTVQLTGGETFVYPGISELLGILRELDYFVTINTNGSLLEKYAKEVVAARIGKLTVSLDGPPEVHDSIRCFPGAHERALAGIRALDEEKKRQGTRYPFIDVKSVISPDNVGQLEPVVKLAGEGRIQMVDFVHLWYLHQSQVDKHREMGFSVDHYTPHAFSLFEPGQLREAMAHVRDLQRRYKKFPFIVFPDIPDDKMDYYYADPLKPLYRTRCIYPYETARILPSGEVVACPEDIAAKAPLGNVREQDLRDIVRGEKAAQFLAQLDAAGGGWPICNRCCGLFRS